MLKRRGFTLIELLVVISVLMVLVAILAPTIAGVSNWARAVRCQANLNTVGKATTEYGGANGGYYFAGKLVQSGTLVYYWGSRTFPVQTATSPLAQYLKPDALLCPSLAWGEFVPESGLTSPTTTYGYNAFCLDPQSYSRTGGRKTYDSIRDPGQLFVFVDAASVTFSAFQNISFVDPPVPPQGMTLNPSTHFRHPGPVANALCADGHTASYETEGADTTSNATKIDAWDNFNLSSVGAANLPHYAQ
ncbi:MAG: type II secretion system protein [Planctomycetota bacterium]|nr:type II secretion system protein [Planctomycetota bacterium]